jgi:hypothetical protein
MPNTPSNTSKGIVLMLIFLVDQLHAQSPKEITNSFDGGVVIIRERAPRFLNSLA